MYNTIFLERFRRRNNINRLRLRTVNKYLRLRIRRRFIQNWES